MSLLVSRHFFYNKSLSKAMLSRLSYCSSMMLLRSFTVVLCASFLEFPRACK